MSAPGPDEIKRVMLNCTDCHTVQRIFESRHTEADFLKVFERMAGYYPGASDLQPPPADSPHRPDEDEDITTRTVTIAEARAMLERGEIVDLKTAYALTLI